MAWNYCENEVSPGHEGNFNTVQCELERLSAVSRSLHVLSVANALKFFKCSHPLQCPVTETTTSIKKCIFMSWDREKSLE